MQKLPNDMNYQGLNFFVRPKAAHIEPYLSAAAPIESRIILSLGAAAAGIFPGNILLMGAAVAGANKGTMGLGLFGC